MLFNTKNTDISLIQWVLLGNQWDACKKGTFKIDDKRVSYTALFDDQGTQLEYPTFTDLENIQAVRYE